ncbi:MAG: hypothetical protein AAFY71_19595 [Bacteroidota bacterium]
MKKAINEIIIVNYEWDVKSEGELIYVEIIKPDNSLRDFQEVAEEFLTSLEEHLQDEKFEKIGIKSTNPNPIQRGVLRIKINLDKYNLDRGEAQKFADEVVKVVKKYVEHTIFLSHRDNLEILKNSSKRPSFLYHRVESLNGPVYGRIISNTTGIYHRTALVESGNFNEENYKIVWDFYWLRICEKLERYDQSLGILSLDPKNEQKQIRLRTEDFLHYFFGQSIGNYSSVEIAQTNSDVNQNYLKEINTLHSNGEEEYSDDIDLESFFTGIKDPLIEVVKKDLFEKEIDETKLIDMVETFKKLAQDPINSDLLEDCMIYLASLIEALK